MGTKKLFLVLVLFGIFYNYSQAQIAWGIRAGLGYTTSQSSEGVNTKGKASFEIGPTAYYSLSRNIYLNSGLNLSFKSFGTENDTNGDLATTMNYTSLELPVNIGTKFSIGDLSFYAQVGPFIGVKLSESIMGQSPGYFNQLNYGVGGAVGIDIKKFKIEVGYQKGLANILSDKFWNDFIGSDWVDYFDFNGKPKVTLNTLFLGVSYVF